MSKKSFIGEAKGKVLFVPLNTNHILIFHEIIKSLSCEYEVLCYDRISDAKQYHTENILKKKQIPYSHFSKSIVRTPKDNLLLKLINFFKMKKLIKDFLEQTSPDLVLLALDNDPIARIFIKESKRRRIKTVLVQEGLIRPHEYTKRETYISDYFYKMMNLLGIYLAYTIKYGTGGCDKILVAGKIASDILKKRGVPGNSISVVGLPKYDGFLKKIKDVQPVLNQQKIYLFAASTKIVHDDRNVKFMKSLVEAAEKLGLYLIIKLHPRTARKSSEIYDIIKPEGISCFEIIKEGDETFDLLKKAYALITVSSTVILEALMMNKECIVANYLAEESRLEYKKYDAVHSIENEDEIFDCIKNSMLHRKSYQNKKRLLNDELHKLDSQAGQKAARLIESMILSENV